jgi:hypothetical protein
MKPVHALHATVDAIPAVLLAAAVALAILAPAPARAQDRADMDRTQVIGNRELPKVLYIAPWKKPVPGDFSGRPLTSVLDEALAPVDRDVFRRTVQYDTQARSVVHSASGGGALATAPAAATTAPAAAAAAATTATAGPAAHPAAPSATPLATAAAPAAPAR